MKRLLIVFILLLFCTSCMKRTYTVTVKCNEPGWGSVSGEGDYLSGDVAIIKANPKRYYDNDDHQYYNYGFDKWQIKHGNDEEWDYSYDNPLIFNVERDVTCIAIFY